MVAADGQSSAGYIAKPDHKIVTTDDIFKPMLCHKPLRYEHPEEMVKRTIGMGVLATPKIDGIRCITHDRGAMAIGMRCITMTRSGRSIPNRHIRDSIEYSCPAWLDGELTVGKNFQACTSGIMRHGGSPDFTYYVFDCCLSLQGLRYDERIKTLEGMRLNGLLPPFVTVLLPKFCRTADELYEYEEECVANGAEGVVYRPPRSIYVQKRASKSNPHMVALKRFWDSEALVIGVDPLMHNDNPIEQGPLGQNERATHGANMVAMPKVGSLYVRDLRTKIEFSIGTGLDDEQRTTWWTDRSAIMGKIVKYKYQPHGVKEKPRHPVFLGIRHNADLPRDEEQAELF